MAKRFCELGYRVRYTTSAGLLEDLRKALAEQCLPRCVRCWSRFDLVIIDEFAFDRSERSECPQAANLFYKVIDAGHPRSGSRQTLHRPGHEHRLRGVERLPGRSAAGHGLLGPRGR